MGSNDLLPRFGGEESRFSTEVVHKVGEKWASEFSIGLKARQFAEIAHDLGRKFFGRGKESAVKRVTGRIIFQSFVKFMSSPKNSRNNAPWKEGRERSERWKETRSQGFRPRVTGRIIVGGMIFLALIGLGVPLSSQTPLKILLSNDDGFDAPGLAVLFEHLSKIGTVTVAASSQESSGASHSVTSLDPILVKESEKNGSKWYNIKATPATCVRLALESLLADKPDFVITGINRGENLGMVTFYSATVGAAREAAFKGIPAIAVNLARGQNMDYGPAAEFVVDLIKSLKDKPLKSGTFLNVNVPNMPKDQIKGVLVVSQDLRATIQFYEKRVNPSGQVYYWSSYKHLEPGTDKTDIWALRNGYITITPLSIDQTNYQEIKTLDSLKIGGWKK